jgi:hypothetical protein
MDEEPGELLSEEEQAHTELANLDANIQRHRVRVRWCGLCVLGGGVILLYVFFDAKSRKPTIPESFMDYLVMGPSLVMLITMITAVTSWLYILQDLAARPGLERRLRRLSADSSRKDA